MMFRFASALMLAALATACDSTPQAAPFSGATDGFQPLTKGSDLGGWQLPAGADGAHWSMREGSLTCEAPAAALWIVREFGDCVLSLDARALEGRPTLVLHARGPGGFEVAFDPKPDSKWSRVRVRLKGEDIDIEIDGEPSQGTLPYVRAKGAVGLSTEGSGRIEIANLSVLEQR